MIAYASTAEPHPDVPPVLAELAAEEVESWAMARPARATRMAAERMVMAVGEDNRLKRRWRNVVATKLQKWLLSGNEQRIER